MSPELAEVVGVLVAALGGAAVGVERERSGHATGPTARFAGVRTFTLLGILAGLSGWLWATGLPWAAGILAAAACALVVAAYAAASRTSVDGTTEVAALVVVAAGIAAGAGFFRLASGIIALTCLLLIEKSRLHDWVARVDDAGLRASVRFAVMAVVILPLLPPGPFGPLGGIRPRELWALVLFFSGLSFVGYIARRSLGPGQGYPVAGLLGGLVSSTSVTLTFARASRSDRELGAPLAAGVLAACTVLFVRVLIAAAVLSLPLAVRLWPYFVAPFVVGVLSVLIVRRPSKGEAVPETLDNPLQIRAALEMAGVFQIVLFLVHLVRNTWGQVGVLVSGAVLGLTDLDALTISMARSVAGGIDAGTAARAVAIGVLSNTVLKLAVAVAIGGRDMRRITGIGLAAMGAAVLLSLVFLR